MVGSAESFSKGDPAADAIKVPPHSVEAEQAVLGALMLDNSSWDHVADLISDSDFYRRDHQIIFRALAALAEKGDPSDAVTVSEFLDNRGELDDAGGLAYLGALAKDTPSAANVRAYADIVRERSVLRQLIRIGNELSESAFVPDGRGSKELIEDAEKLVFEIAEQGSRKSQTYIPIKSLLRDAVERIDELINSDESLTGTASGIDKFDEMTSGMQRSDLIILAARPSMGKTSLAMNFAEHAAIHSKQPVAIFSMEMSGEQLAMRMISSLGRVDQSKVRNGDISEEDWPRITSAIHLMSEAPIFIDDTPALTPTELRARCRRIKREHGLGLVVVDYLQLMRVAGMSENRTNEISEISRGLKALAKELDVPVIALSQLNRNLEQRPDKRPKMADLRESGGIEQDADVIVFIYRDEVYNPDTPHKGMAELIIEKQRNGPTGKVITTFLGSFTRFENYISEDEFME
ncbi:replicative DNA helicase [Natronospira proteinivora]|uniref:Replicative DNA helicase n=1 Tax=Natronospira proteinivora TaxID=1807133 RepID=A0ABT1G7I4_9GAMM|nr:replicative DNA helicase [Natronospira proteinivora]MCP1726318.1 replicative DNA helicase [Natronospira proteinivora]